jgi:hypothetical protein
MLLLHSKAPKDKDEYRIIRAYFLKSTVKKSLEDFIALQILRYYNDHSL